jgi:hypothetical protein
MELGRLGSEMFSSVMSSRSQSNASRANDQPLRFSVSKIARRGISVGRIDGFVDCRMRIDGVIASFPVEEASKKEAWGLT